MAAKVHCIHLMFKDAYSSHYKPGVPIQTNLKGRTSIFEMDQADLCSSTPSCFIFATTPPTHCSHRLLSNEIGHPSFKPIRMVADRHTALVRHCITSGYKYIALFKPSNQWPMLMHSYKISSKHANAIMPWKGIWI
ncbi:hypothetical protein GDO86_002648 [Hymenochirus boettgeri]|uniref:Uncharacterized protein n=1 Tax=Hymenochirus boettgeri TaxID=247094 RepID=A0A8T2JY16_9PIPI|nr:hypothetical protein GDO86_002648 [Hymenochirus boettgeri]